MIFETARLLVRQYNLDDAENFYLLNSDADVMKYIRTPKTRQQAFQFLQENIQYYNEFPVYGRWALIEKLNQQFIGSFMLRPSTAVNDKIELGYAMFKNHWGKGYATESVKGGLDFAFRHLLLPDVIAITQTENISSQKVLLKCGFIQHENINDNGRMVNFFSIQNNFHG
ncbi:MAG TPA: GNAT family N-acetyltransferase [Puia sp.]|jgi:ribosomal-protein-alanine N-acetyltransferase|nr:GNAT family N-acetyltransferase [Puia sp.]